MTMLHVPVLMYHAIGEPPESNSGMTVSPAAFAAQLDCLRDEGFHTITAGQFSAALSADAAGLDDRTVILTFDDGYEDFYTRAMPLLDEHGFTATVFVTTGWTQDAGIQRAVERSGRMLNWSQITEAALAGIEIGAHSHRHPQLDQLPERLLREELYTSKAHLEDRLGHHVAGMAYPFGYSNAKVRRLARDAGYDYSCAVANATASPESDLFALPRLTIHRSTTIAEFRRLIHGRITMTLLRDRALTKGWAVPRRARAMLKRLPLPHRGGGLQLPGYVVGKPDRDCVVIMRVALSSPALN